MCSRCGEEFPEEKREHEDYHFALDLSTSEGPVVTFPDPGRGLSETSRPP